MKTETHNLELYERFRVVPEEAKKKIRGGRLKGMTDINPMWRLKALTAQFGPVGFGWKYEIVEKKIVDGSGGQKVAVVDINLYYKMNGEWSEPIPGTGGSMFVENQSKGAHTNDECYKMALTDAISVACKALGMGANVYWSNDRTKYNPGPKPAQVKYLSDDKFRAKLAHLRPGLQGEQQFKNQFTSNGYAMTQGQLKLLSQQVSYLSKQQ